MEYFWRLIGRGKKRKAEDAFQDVEAEARESPEQEDVILGERIKTAEMEKGSDNAGTKTSSSSGGRGRKRQAENAVQKEKTAPAKRMKTTEIPHGGTSGGKSTPEISISGGRGRKRKPESALQKEETAPAKQMKTTEIQHGGSCAPESSSSGGRGRKRKPESALQKEETAPTKRMKTTEIQHGGSCAPESSSSGRGRKRKPESALQKEETAPTKRMKTTEIQHGESSSSGSRLDDYVIGKKLGKGNTGTVYVATRKSDGQKVAIKFIDKSKPDLISRVDGFSEEVVYEAHIMMHLKRPPLCPHIIDFYDYFIEGDYYIVVMEYSPPCMTLGTYIRRNDGRLSESVARQIAMQLLIATQHCIERGVEHPSMHLENILVNPKTLQVKLIDFSSSNILNMNCRRSHTLGAKRYRLRSGELLRTLHFVVENYVLQIGKLLLRMVNGFVNRIGWFGKPRFHHSASAEFRDLLWWIFSFDYSEGPVLEEILEHKWFSMK